MMKESLPEVTVIIPTYRRPELLKRAILSVLNQSYRAIRVKVLDNFSQDETADVVAAFKDQDVRVEYYCQPKNLGAVGNFQSGVLQVETPFFSLLSDDDFLLPNFIEQTMRGFERHPEAVFSACSVVTMTDHGEILYEPLSLWQREGLFMPPEGLLEMVGEKHPIWTGILFRHQVIDLTGGLDIEIGAVDLDFVFRISADSPYVVSKVPVAVCVNHDLSSSRIASLSSYWPSWMKIIGNIEAKKRLPRNIREDFRERMTIQIINEIFWIGIRSFEAGDFEQLRKAAEALAHGLEEQKKSQLLNFLNSYCTLQPLWFTGKVLLSTRRCLAGFRNKERLALQERHANLARGLRLERHGKYF